MDIAKQLKTELGIELWQAEAVIKLIDEGNTIPFIARYRKEMHGALNDEVLRNFDERLKYLRNLEEKKETVLASIEEQGKLTDELKEKIEAAKTQAEVDDLYRPYRPKCRTRATIAKEKGLEPLANIITLQMTDKSLEQEAAPYVNPDAEDGKAAKTVEEAIAGAMDIIAENISDNADYHTYIRKATFDKGLVVSTAKNPDEKSVYEMYYNFEDRVNKIAGYRVLAINRGEAEKILTVKITAPVEDILRYLEKQVIVRENPNTTDTLKAVCEDAYTRLIASSIETELRNTLTEKAAFIY